MLSSLGLVSLAFGCDCDRVWECKGESRSSKAAHTIAFEAILIKQAAAAKLTPWLLLSLLMLLLLHVVYMALCRLSPLRLFGCSAVWLFGCSEPLPFLPRQHHARKSRNEKCFVRNFSFHLYRASPACEKKLGKKKIIMFCFAVCVCRAAIKPIEHELLSRQHEQLMQHMLAGRRNRKARSAAR